MKLRVILILPAVLQCITCLKRPAPPDITVTPTGCICPDNYKPVCGKNGITYSNSCRASGSKIGEKCSGKCPCKTEDCICPLYKKPVCGVDGQTYSNACQAECKKKSVQCQGKCPCKIEIPTDQCICPAVYDPVCGANGQTYSNSCEASCSKTPVKCPGKCPCGKATLEYIR